MTFVLVISAAVLEAIVSFAGGLLVITRESFAKFFAHRVLGFAVGALVGVAFFDLIPEALAALGERRAFPFVVFGILLFFAVERLLLWYHCHNEECKVHNYAYLVLAGDAVHNFIDGIILALAFGVSTEVGIATTVAVVVHEVPQEIADFGILLRAGFNRSRALFWNFVVSLTTIAGALLALVLGSYLEAVLPYAIAIIAGNFLYLALADLLPELHEETSLRHFGVQFGLMVAGVSVMYMLVSLLEG